MFFALAVSGLKLIYAGAIYTVHVSWKGYHQLLTKLEEFNHPSACSETPTHMF